ncbi:helix-turn-helix transcriptional regulator [Fusobacterium varium]|jgi:DNA-binding HxlR family transcriptional regulator|uniref:winged helix-turn-helix transcriptional regulator n=1 Tax=Fusobacterium TaxID=848 RepID=UPI001032CED5|nr:helix-turn-helix domain-containing protein [Fusobacterium ulcerans]
MDKLKYINESEKSHDVIYNNKCPILYALKIIGQKWKLPILWHLSKFEMLHYNELKRCVTGITNTILTKCLRELESDGLVSRFQHNTIPPSVEYRLTERGKSLLPALNELYYWGKEQIELKDRK